MITLLQLQYFQTLAQEENLTRAAKKLYISQTTLSAMLTKMENEIGVQLFDRKNGRMYLNGYGELYLKHVSAALEELEAAQREVDLRLRSDNSRLAIATFSDHVFLDLIISFSSQYPQYRIEQHHIQPQQAAEKLLNRELDFVLASAGDLPDSEFASQTVLECGLCLVVLPSSPLAQRGSISLSELADQPMVNLTHDTPFQRFCDGLFAAAGIAPPSVAECSYMMRPYFTAKGVGAAITNDVEFCRAIFPGHVFVPISDENTKRKIALFWVKNRGFSPAMADFFQVVCDYAPFLENHREEKGEGESSGR